LVVALPCEPPADGLEGSADAAWSLIDAPPTRERDVV
jgi:hypothetical protein